MDERAALAMLGGELDSAGDDAAVVDGLVVTTDMLHERTDFPPGTTRYTAGWRSVGASLSDVAAMGCEAVATVAVYADDRFDKEELRTFVRGASDVCETVGAEYVGGDLDHHEEFTTATTAVGRIPETGAVYRTGARPGDAVCVTGTLGRSAAALELFDRGEPADVERANELFRFEPRVGPGRALAVHATAMMDVSDGLARSLHQLAEAGDCGFAIDSGRIPIADALADVAGSREDALGPATTFGEDFELVFTLPEGRLDRSEAATDTALSRIGTVREEGVLMDDKPLADEGYTH